MLWTTTLFKKNPLCQLLIKIRQKNLPMQGAFPNDTRNYITLMTFTFKLFPNTYDTYIYGSGTYRFDKAPPGVPASWAASAVSANRRPSLSSHSLCRLFPYFCLGNPTGRHLSGNTLNIFNGILLTASEMYYTIIKIRGWIFSLTIGSMDSNLISLVTFKSHIWTM